MRFSLLFIFTAISTSIFAQQLGLEWVANMKGPQNDQGRDIVVDSEGNVYVTGGFNETVDMDPSSGRTILASPRATQPFVQKLNSEGELLWATSLEGIYWGHGFALDLDSDGNIIATGSCRAYPNLDESNPVGRQTSNMFVWKLDPEGNTLWKRGFVTQKEMVGKGLDISTDGKVLIAGSFRGKTDLDPGPGEFLVDGNDYYNAFGLVLDEDGNFIWASSFGGARNDYGADVAVDSTGAFYLVGSFEVSPKTGEMCSSTRDLGHQDIFIHKHAPDGSMEWNKTIGGNRFDAPEEVVVDPKGNVIVTGSFMQTVDFDPGSGINYLTTDEHPNDWVECKDAFVLKLDSLGNHIWAVGFGGRQDDHPFSVQVDSLGNVYTCGIFHKAVDFDPGYDKYVIRSSGSWDGYVHKLNSDGEFIWAYSIGSIGWDFATGLEVDHQGHVYTTGYFERQVNFDPSDTKSEYKRAKGHDVYVQKITQSVHSPETDTANRSMREVLSPSGKEGILGFVHFPNPATNFVTIKLAEAYDYCVIRVYDSSGQVVITQKADLRKRIQIDTSALASGYYLLEVDNGAFSESEKLVIQK